jgi:tetratricopeptide (TPR) repeat protein
MISGFNDFCAQRISSLHTPVGLALEMPSHLEFIIILKKRPKLPGCCAFLVTDSRIHCSVSMPTNSLRSFSRISPAVWLFFLTLGIRLFVLIRLSQSVHFLPDGDDMKFYSDWALRIAHGQWTDHKAFYGLPGYAYVLAGIFSLVGFDPFTVGLLQSVMDAAISVLLYKLAFVIFRSEPQDGGGAPTSRGAQIGIAAALGWAFFTPAQAFATILMPTVWLVLAYWLCVWWAVKTETSSWWKPWLGLGIFIGVIATLVATILFAVPILIAAIYRSVDRGRPPGARMPKIVAAILVLVSGLFVGTSPVWFHNYFIAREPVLLSAHGGINFWIGNNPTANGYPKMPPGIRATQEGLLRDSITLAEQAAGKKLTRAEVSKFWSAQANHYIHDHFFSWLKLMSVKFRNFWNAYQYDDLSIIKLFRDDGVLPPGLRFGFVAALGLAGCVPVLRRFPRAWWVAAAVFLHMCALMPVFVTERYRLAAAPGLLILAAGGLWIFWENLTTARWKPVAAYIVLACFAGWFVSIPLPPADQGLWSLDHYKAGIRATTAGDLDRAQRNLETAFAYVQNNADINFALGNLWLAKSDRATDPREKARERGNAKIFYRRALDLNPRHTGTLNNLGVLAMEEKLWDLAERFFLASLESEPGDATRLYLVARVRFEAGKRAEAQTALDEALKIRPHQIEFLELQEKLRNPKPPTPPSAGASDSIPQTEPTPKQ